MTEILKTLRFKLEDRGYPTEMINTQFERALKFDREDLLKPKHYPHGAAIPPLDHGKQNVKPTFIITYHPHAPDIRK